MDCFITLVGAKSMKIHFFIELDLDMLYTYDRLYYI